MYDYILLLLYLIILITALIVLLRQRDRRGRRRLAVGFAVVAVLLAPTAAGFLCELFASLLTIGLVFFGIFAVIGLFIKSIFG